MAFSTVDSKASLNHGLSTTTGVTMRTIDATETVTGEYDGVAGQYVFTVVTVLEWDGTTLTLGEGTMAGSVLFKADDPDTVIPDRDYLAFGVWAEVPDSPTTANPGRVRPFVKGSAGQFDIADVMPLTGSASYSGGAVGHYATRAKGDHMVEEGRFTASASLTANFDKSGPAAYEVAVVVDAGDDVPASVTATGTILTGMITDFMTEDGTAMPGWLVNLNGGTMTPDLAEANTAVAAADDNANAAEILAAGLAAGLMEVDVLGTTSGTTGSQAFYGCVGGVDVWQQRCQLPDGCCRQFPGSDGYRRAEQLSRGPDPVVRPGCGSGLRGRGRRFRRSLESKTARRPGFERGAPDLTIHQPLV